MGYNQLDWKIRQDERVVCMERTNFRYMTPADLAYGAPQFACIDVSFISLKIIFPVLKQLLEKNGEVVALIKPQFEAGKKDIGKHGIVRDRKVHERVLSEIDASVAGAGLFAVDYTFSPVKGGSGNIEYLAELRKTSETPLIRNFRELVENSFSKLKEQSYESSIVP